MIGKHACPTAGAPPLWRNGLPSNTGLSMGNKIVTEADRKRSPKPRAIEGYTPRRNGGGQRISLERGVATHNKKNPGKRPHQGG
jgi:hypothetical protein